MNAFVATEKFPSELCSKEYKEDFARRVLKVFRSFKTLLYTYIYIGKNFALCPKNLNATYLTAIATHSDSSPI